MSTTESAGVRGDEAIVLGGEQEARPAPAAPDLASAGRRWALGIGLSVLSGLLLVWALEDFHVSVFIWFGFVPALVAQHRILPARWSGLGFGIAVGILFQGYLGPGLSNADLAWYLYVYGIWIGLFVALIAWRSRRFQARTGYRWFLLTMPLAYVALEFVRTQMTEVFGGSWGMLPYALYHRPAFLQPVSVFGIHGLTLLILLVNFALARLVLTYLDQQWGPPEDRPALEWPTARRSAAVVAGLVAVWGIGSLAMMREPAPDVRVAAVQPDPYTPAKDADIDQATELARNVEQTEFAAAQGADLVVWHEAGLVLDARGPDGQQFADLADRLDIYLAVGWQLPTEGDRRFNEVASFGPDGQFLGTYGKSHPGEFAGDYSDRQGEYVVYDTPFGAFGSIICFDLDFLDSARNVARLDGSILAVSSNDVLGITEKHYTHLVFRAIETRLAAVKADSAYDSAIIDPYGRILDVYANKATGRATLVGDVPAGSGDTLYVKWGDWFAWIALLATAGFLVYGGYVRWGRPRNRD